MCYQTASHQNTGDPQKRPLQRNLLGHLRLEFLGRFLHIIITLACQEKSKQDAVAVLMQVVVDVLLLWNNYTVNSL